MVFGRRTNPEQLTCTFLRVRERERERDADRQSDRGTGGVGQLERQ